MKIEATCGTCSRTFVLSQIDEDSEAPGRCPFCGARFARHYSGLLIDAVKGAEGSAAEFVNALGLLQGMDTGFEIDIERLLATVSDQIRSADHRVAR